MRFVTPHLLKRAATGVSLACLAASAAPFATASNTAASSSSGGKTCDAPGTIASAFVRPPATVNGGATPSFRLGVQWAGGRLGCTDR